MSSAKHARPVRVDVHDMRGQRIGKWTVLWLAPRLKSEGHRCAHWVCRCECGTIQRISGLALRVGNTTQCMRCFRAAITVPEAERVCRWCGRPTNKRGDVKPKECGACNRMGLPSRNGRDAEGRPISKGKRRVVAS